MEFNKIIAVTGKPGLFEILTKTKSGIVVRSLTDNKRFPLTATHNVSLLENIAIYTYETEVPLAEVFTSIAKKENNKEALSHKENDSKLESYFAEVLPNYDSERVYVSNIKKVIQWYNLLVKANFNFDLLTTETATQEEKE